MNMHILGEGRTNIWHGYRCLFTISQISTCFGHHYAHRQENRLYKTAWGVRLDALAAVVRSWDTSWTHCVNVGIFTQCAQVVSRLHTTAASTSRLTPHTVLYSLFSWRWA